MKRHTRSLDVQLLFAASALMDFDNNDVKSLYLLDNLDHWDENRSLQYFLSLIF